MINKERTQSRNDLSAYEIRVQNHLTVEDSCKMLYNKGKFQLFTHRPSHLVMKQQTVTEPLQSPQYTGSPSFLFSLTEYLGSVLLCTLYDTIKCIQNHNWLCRFFFTNGPITEFINVGTHKRAF